MKILTGIIFIVVSLVSSAQNKEIHKGNLLYIQSQFERAEAQYRQAIKKDSSNNIAKYNLANALHKQKKYEEAVLISGRVAESAANIKLKSAAWYNQGVSFTKLKKLEESIESYKNALRLNPNDNQARENLQKAILELKKKQQQQQQKPKSRISQKEAEQKLKLLQQKEKQIQQRLQNKSKQTGKTQGQDW